MNILYINKVSPLHGGGAEARIWEVGKRMVELGHNLTVICGKTQPNLPSSSNVSNIEIQYLKTLPEFAFNFPRASFYLSRFNFYLSSRPTLQNFVKDHQIDIIRDDISPFPSFAGASIAKQYKIPLLGTVHNLGGTLKKWCQLYGIFMGTIGFYAERWIRRNKPYSHIISDSEWMRESFEVDIPKHQLTWIPNGIDVSTFYPKSNNQEILDQDKPINIFYGARFIDLKGHDILIKALPYVIQAGHSIKLHLAGDGPLTKNIQTLTKQLDLQSHVVFYGKLSRHEMPAKYREMDIYVSPSRFEGLPVTFIEAMASGLPIISTRIEAVQGVLNEPNAFLVDVDSPEKMANAIIELSQDVHRRTAMGRWGVSEVQKKYTWDIITQNEIEICTRLIHDSKS